MRDRISAIAAISEKEVLVGRLPRLGQDDPEVGIAIMPGDDFPDEELQRSYRRWEIDVHVLARKGDWIDFEETLFEPVMTAIEDERASPSRVTVGTAKKPGSTLGGLCSGLVRETVTPVERVEGTRAEGVTIAYSLAYRSSPGLT